jgi:hypothetical protein
MACAIVQPRSGIFPKNASGLEGVVASRGAFGSGFIFEPTIRPSTAGIEARIQRRTLPAVGCAVLLAIFISFGVKLDVESTLRCQPTEHRRKNDTFNLRKFEREMKCIVNASLLELLESS